MVDNRRLITGMQELMPASQGDASAAAFVGALAGALIASLAPQNAAQPATNEHLLLLQQQNLLLQQQNAALIEALRQQRPTATSNELVKRTSR